MKENLDSAIVASLLDGIILIDPRGIMTQVNPAAAEIFGYSPDEMIGNNVSMLMPLPHNKAHDAYVENYLKTGKGKIVGVGREVEAVRKDGSEFPMDLAITKTEVDGETYFIGNVRDITPQRNANDMLRMNEKVMRAINTALSSFINADIPKRDIFDNALERVLDITDSEYGFIGEILHKDDSTPYLKTHAITDISWNNETRKFYNDNVMNGLEFTNLNTLFGITIRTGETVISNDPTNDVRRGGLPHGHPALDAYLGLPIFSGNMLIGMAGISNRPQGYDESLAYHLKPLMGTIGSLIAGYQNIKSRRRAEEELYKAQETLRKVATTDALTGLDNRASLYMQLESVFRNFEGTDDTLSIMFIDIDNFKQINDSYGHSAGDEVLISVSGLLQESIRPDDIIGRYGGEELVVGLPNCDIKSAHELAERLRQGVEESDITAMTNQQKATIPVTISVGVASIEKSDTEIDELINRSDKAVYQAKGEGKNRTVVYKTSVEAEQRVH